MHDKWAFTAQALCHCFVSINKHNVSDIAFMIVHFRAYALYHCLLLTTPCYYRIVHFGI